MHDSMEGSDAAPELRPLGILIVEDSTDDLALLLLALQRAGYAPDSVRVHDAEGMRQALAARTWDIVLSDYNLPDYSGLAALEQVRAFDPDLPFIIVSGNIGEDVAVAAMKAGAHDYLIKGKLARLGAAIEREVREAAVRRARHRNERELDTVRLRLQALSSRLLDVQEAERRHLARELHDEIGQSLTAIKLGLDALQTRLPDDPARARVADVAAIAEQLIEQVRALSLDLRPPQLDDLGLAAALLWLVKRRRRADGPKLCFDPPENLPRLEPRVETACFRIAQEALTNALRHAGAANIRIETALGDERFSLCVRDDGCGFDLPAAQERALRGGSLGLVGMQERVSLAGGTLGLVSRPGTGSEVCATFALTAADPAMPLHAA